MAMSLLMMKTLICVSYKDILETIHIKFVLFACADHITDNICWAKN